MHNTNSVSDVLMNVELCYTETAELLEESRASLSIPDPDLETALAKIKENTICKSQTDSQNNKSSE